MNYNLVGKLAKNNLKKTRKITDSLDDN